jgi:hypothetical protein
VRGGRGGGSELVVGFDAEELPDRARVQVAVASMEEIATVGVGLACAIHTAETQPPSRGLRTLAPAATVLVRLQEMASY